MRSPREIGEGVSMKVRNTEATLSWGRNASGRKVSIEADSWPWKGVENEQADLCYIRFSHTYQSLPVLLRGRGEIWRVLR